MGGLVGKDNAKRIGEAVKTVEAMTMKNTTKKNRERTDQKGILAEVTNAFAAARYALKEMRINTGGGGIADKTKPRIWDGEPGNLPQAFEINDISFLPPGTRVFVQHGKSPGEGKNKWYFDSGGGPTKAKKHVELDISDDFLQFTNDVSVAAVDSELGPALYGELPIFRPGAEGLPAEIAWRNLFSVATDSAGNTSGDYRDGYLVPQFGLAGGGEVSLTDANQRHLRFKNLGRATGSRQLNIFHSVLPDSELDNVNEMFPGHTSTTGFYILNQGAIDALPADANPVTHTELKNAVDLVNVDALGHIKCIDGVCTADKYEPPTFTADFLLDVAYTGSYPTSGTLYDVTIAQETRVTDGAGADVVAADGEGVNRLKWQVKAPAATVPAKLTPGIPQNPSFSGDSTNYDAAKFGSDTAIDHDLSRIFNCTFKLDGEDTEKVTNGTSADLITDFIVLADPAFQIVPDNDTDFNIFFELQDVLGSQYTRFNGTGRYQIDAFLYFKSDGLAPDANGDQKPAVPITDGSASSPVVSYDGASKSGADITFNITIPGTSVDDQLCVIFYVNHIDPVTPAIARGFIFDGSNGASLTNDIDSENNCSAIVGAGLYTCTLTVTPGTITDTDFDEETQGITAMADLFQTVFIAVEILKSAAATTDFSDAGKTFTLQIEAVDGSTLLKFSNIEGSSGVEPGITVAGAIVPNSGGAGVTDGFEFRLEAYQIETGIEKLAAGELTAVATVEGCPNVLRMPLIIDGSNSNFCWGDDFTEGEPAGTQPVAYYKFDGDLTDETGVYDASTSGSVTFPTDEGRDQVVFIDQPSDEVNIPALAEISSRFDDWTIAFWVKVDIDPTVINVLYLQNLLSPQTKFNSNISNANMIVGGSSVFKAGDFRALDFIHFAGSRRHSPDGAGETHADLKFYINGVLVDTEIFANANFAGGAWELGGASGGFGLFVDNLIFFNAIATDADILNIFENDAAILSAFIGPNTTRWIESITGGGKNELLNGSLIQTIPAASFGNTQVENDAPISALDLFDITASFDSAGVNFDENGQLAFLEFTTADPFTFRASVFLDSGNQTVKFEEVISGDSVEFIQADQSGDLTFSRTGFIANDNFSGTDQNSFDVTDALFTTRWLAQGTGTLSISNNKLFGDALAGSSDATARLQIPPLMTEFIGDFEVSATINLESADINDNIGIEFILGGGAGNTIFEIILTQDGAGSREIVYFNGSSFPTVPGSSGATTGDFKFTRTGTTIKTFVNGIELDSRTHGTFTTQSVVRLKTKTFSSAQPVQGSFENVIVKLNGSNFSEPRVFGNYKNETKIIFDDVATMPSDPTLRIETTGAADFEWEWTDFKYEIPIDVDYCTTI